VVTAIRSFNYTIVHRVAPGSVPLAVCVANRLILAPSRGFL
jgi:hypothetical protein